MNARNRFGLLVFSMFTMLASSLVFCGSAWADDEDTSYSAGFCRAGVAGDFFWLTWDQFGGGVRALKDSMAVVCPIVQVNGVGNGYIQLPSAVYVTLVQGEGSVSCSLHTFWFQWQVARLGPPSLTSGSGRQTIVVYPPSSGYFFPESWSVSCNLSNGATLLSYSVDASPDP